MHDGIITSISTKILKVSARAGLIRGFLRGFFNYRRSVGPSKWDKILKFLLFPTPPDRHHRRRRTQHRILDNCLLPPSPSPPPSLPLSLPEDEKPLELCVGRKSAPVRCFYYYKNVGDSTLYDLRISENLLKLDSFDTLSWNLSI